MAGASKQCCIGVILQKVSCSYKAVRLLIPGFQIQISDRDLMKNLEVRWQTRYTKVNSTTLVLIFSGSLIQRKIRCAQSLLSINIVEKKMKSIQLCPRHLVQVLALIAYSQYTKYPSVQPLERAYFSSDKISYLQAFTECGHQFRQHLRKKP